MSTSLRGITRIVAVIAVLGLAGWWALDRWAPEPFEIESEELHPPGRWHRQGDWMGDVDDDLARTLSLPYVSGSQPRRFRVGVLQHDPERSWPGLNLYVSGHAPEAILMDMEGSVLHRWQATLERALPQREPSLETGFFRRAALLPGGDLLALYQGGGLVRLDRESQVVWSIGLGTYNDFFVAADGTILTLTKDARIEPEIHPEEPILEDSVVRIGPSGEIVARHSILEALLSSPYRDQVLPFEKTGDILHSNTVTPIEAAGPAASAFEPGHLLLSLREVDLIAILDPESGEMTWARQGPWARQHEPVLLPNGGLLIFDNKGGEGATRVLELDAPEGEIVWDYRADASDPLHSPEGGSVSRLPNGNTLITDSEAGRAIEVEPGGEIVWQFASPHRAGSRGELVATLWEVQRLPETAADWLTAP